MNTISKCSTAITIGSHVSISDKHRIIGSARDEQIEGTDPFSIFQEVGEIMDHQYDVVVLGGGIGGYTAAIRAAQLGKKVALVEKAQLGGTCLHRGCIPSKTLLRSAEMAHLMKTSEEYGIQAGSVSVDFDKVQNRKSNIVKQLHQGVQFLVSKHKITVYEGNGRIVAPTIFSPERGQVAVEAEDGEIETLIPQHLILATGSSARGLHGLTMDGENIMTSNEALNMAQLPSSVVIIGGGVIGVEWASLLNDFGVEVTIVEYAERLLPSEDKDISRELARLFKKRGIRVVTGAKVLTESIRQDQEYLTVQAESGEKAESFRCEKILVSVGRSANVERIGLENTDIVVEHGVIKVNEFMQTAESNIYAVGDVVGGMQLAHVAAQEGKIAAEHIAGLHPQPLSRWSVPRCIYSRPEIASLGRTEQEAEEQGFEVNVGRVSFKSIGKALVYGASDGFVKVVKDSKTDDILGVHMIGPHVTDLISEAALADVLNASPWEVGQTIHPHPTLSEALVEAMLDVEGQAL